MSSDSQAKESSPSSKQFFRPWLRNLAILLVGFAILLSLDSEIYEIVHQNYNYHTRPVPDHLKIATRVLRSMEDWGENVYILVVCFAIWHLDRHRRSRLVCIALSALFVAGPVEVVKRLSGRERPEISQGQLKLHGPSRWTAGGDYQSFPSGHTAAAAVYSGSLSAFYPPLRPVCIAMAVGCGANRIWKERHYASDCWVSGLLGFWFAFTLPRRRWVRPVLDWFDRRFSDPLPKVAFGAVRSSQESSTA